MAKMPNALIAQLTDAEIARRVKRGELFLPETVTENLIENLTVWTKMMTIAVNRGLGIGKTRFQRDVQPILDQLQSEFFQNKDDAYGDSVHAVAVIERMYDEIME